MNNIYIIVARTVPAQPTSRSQNFSRSNRVILTSAQYSVEEQVWMMGSSSYTCSTCDSGTFEDDSDVSPAFKKRKLQDGLTDTDNLRMTAVKRNDLDSLMRLSDATEWYKFVHPKTGNTLLYHAVAYQAKEVFDYLLSFADLPLEHENNRGDTVLFSCLIRCGRRRYDYYACALIKRGAFVDFNEPVLHHAIKNQMVETSKLLMDKGYDVNARNRRGMTPLSLCLLKNFDVWKDKEEIALALLYHGADPTSSYRESYNAFELSVKNGYGSFTLHEAFMLFMIDDYTSMDVQLEVIFDLGERQSPFVRDILKHAKNITVSDELLRLDTFYSSLCFMHVDILDAVIKKCPHVLWQLFPRANDDFLYARLGYQRKFFLENINRLLESNLRERCFDHMYINDVQPTDMLPSNESFALEYLCLLLSYGLELTEYIVFCSHYLYGFGELLTFLLRMDTGMDASRLEDAFLILLYDVSSDSKQILDKVCRSGFAGDRTKLLPYFADEGLRALCSDDNRPTVIATITNQPKVPLLVELARNAFRKYFVRTFGIKTASRFYILLDRLPISTEHRKIISFERQLY